MRPHRMLRLDREGLCITLRSWDFLLGALMRAGKAAGSLRVITKGMTSPEFSFRSSFCSGKVIFLKPPHTHTPNNPLEITPHERRNITLTLQTQLQDDPSLSPYLSLHVDTYLPSDCHVLLRETSLTMEIRSRSHTQKLTRIF